jgi:CheY-like chemotaxis protein
MAKVLVVDDTEIVRKALEKALRRMGHTAVPAADGQSARALALLDPPDLALLDFRMPGMDGVELFEALRRELGPRCPPVLFVTATPAAEVADRLARVGLRAAGYVKKPFHLDDLMRTVTEALAAPAAQGGAPCCAALGT